MSANNALRFAELVQQRPCLETQVFSILSFSSYPEISPSRSNTGIVSTRQQIPIRPVALCGHANRVISV